MLALGFLRMKTFLWTNFFAVIGFVWTGVNASRANFLLCKNSVTLNLILESPFFLFKLKCFILSGPIAVNIVTICFVFEILLHNFCSDTNKISGAFFCSRRVEKQIELEMIFWNPVPAPLVYRKLGSFNCWNSKTEIQFLLRGIPVYIRTGLRGNFRFQLGRKLKNRKTLGRSKIFLKSDSDFREIRLP